MKRFASLSLILLISFLTVTAQSPKNGSAKSPDTKQQQPVEIKQNSPNNTGFDRPPLAKPKARADVKEDVLPDIRGAKNDEIKLAVDLVLLDAQVMQQKTGRVVGTLKKEDFNLLEDGSKQQITHFSQDTLPLSVILLIDRGGCLDPFSEKVRRATLEALRRLRPQDEVALMAFHNTVDLLAGFGLNKDRVVDALDHLPPHDEEADHCFNRAFYDAAEYMNKAANPDGRRVIIVITGITTYFNCSGPTGEESRMAVLESGSVVCGIIPKTAEQRMESGVMRAVTGIGGMFKAKSSNLKQLAEETGGEVLSDKPENLNSTFNDLIDHLRTRYSIGFISTNTRRDGTFRKLKLEITQPTSKSDERLVVRTKRGYIAAKPSIEKTRTH
ncbi:MAG: VWA domain-containing protein [Blastocatellia bacterium]